MTTPLFYWCDLYRKNKDRCVCLDIETTGFNKPISVVGFYRPTEGQIQVTQLIRGEALNAQNIRTALADCMLLVTFNGLSFDLPRLREEFPGCIPNGVAVLDLYRVARRLGLNTNLKVLETTFGIERLDERTQRRGSAVKLWRRYEEKDDHGALAKLLDYNAQDTANLFALAEILMGRINAQADIHKAE